MTAAAFYTESRREQVAALWVLIRQYRPDDLPRLEWHWQPGPDRTPDALAWDAFGLPAAAVLNADPSELRHDWRNSRRTAIAATDRARAMGWQAA